MIAHPSDTLLNLLLELPHETECAEFKRDKAEPPDIGEYLSALANSAALLGEKRGFIAWGIDDKTREVVGTSFRPRKAKVGNEELENWLATQLSPSINFRIHELDHGGHHIVIFEVPAAALTPVRFRGEEYIRVGSYKKKLRDHPDKERDLWAAFSREPFEKGLAVQGVSSDDVLALLDYPAYFELTSQSLPTERRAILERLVSERLILAEGRDSFGVTNLGGILFAKRLAAFEGLARKALRVVTYQGMNRVNTLREQDGARGYASGFEGLIAYINGQLPQNEQIGQALRKEVRMYPEVAIRELVANAIIHQDFLTTGTGPMVEIFRDRVEITNPGTPLIPVERFLDAPPQSRNDLLAAFMRRLNICEERGSGIDKVFFSVELFQLPAPDFTVTANHTKVVLYAPRKLSEMSRDDRIRACYQHAGLQYVSNSQMTNATLRKRFGISDKNYSMASRIISETLQAGIIKPFDPSSRSRKHARYVPFWA